MVDVNQRLARPAPPPPNTHPVAAPRAFTDLYTTHYPALLRTVMHIGATEHEAEDAVADAMAEVLRHWPRLTNPVAYARTAAASNFIKARTRGLDRIRRRMIERGIASTPAAEDPDLTEAENTEWVRQHLAALPPAEHAVMALTFDDYQPVEIAAILGKSQAAVRRNLHDARHRLMKILQQYEDGDGRKPDSSATPFGKEAR